MAEKIFVTDVEVEKVRHLENFKIPVDENEMKHLIFTGKNGSGKTTILDAISHFLECNIFYEEKENLKYGIDYEIEALRTTITVEKFEKSMLDIEKHRRRFLQYDILTRNDRIRLSFNKSIQDVNEAYQDGKFVYAYYPVNRIMTVEIPKHIEKVNLQERYKIDDIPGNDFVKYLLDMKMTEALALAGGKKETAAKITNWFENFELLLKDVFEDNTVKLVFDEEKFSFMIHQENRIPFDFNTLPSGYAAIMNIIVDLMMRMEKKVQRKFDFSLPGLVLIDEVDAHLHLTMQKRVMKILETFFPNIQFIVSTHSPFVLNSVDNAVIYDLESGKLVKESLTDIPYEGIIKGYFEADTLSAKLKEKYEKFKVLVAKEKLSDEELEEIGKLEFYLDEIPDYLALDITTEYERLKREFEQREDL